MDDKELKKFKGKRVRFEYSDWGDPVQAEDTIKKIGKKYVIFFNLPKVKKTSIQILEVIE